MSTLRAIEPAKSKGLALAVDLCTDIENAARFVAEHGNEIRFSEGLGDLVFDGARWTPDDTRAWMRFAQATIEGMFAESLTMSEKEGAAYGRWAAYSARIAGLKAMQEIARSAVGVMLLASAFDRDPMACNTLSGLISLENGTCRPTSPSDAITKLAPTFCHPSPEHPRSLCPNWLTFLWEVMGRRDHLVDYLQRVVGYWLTGKTSEQCFWVFYGSGANGKSTLLEVIRRVMGDYSYNAPASTFLEQHADSGPRPELVALRGRRLVTASETGEGARLAEPLIKVVTGNDTLTARGLRKDPIEFVPACKLVLCTNHKPVIRGDDYGIWRRVRMLEFGQRFDKNAKPNLMEDLLKESDGILAWAVQGCLLWQKHGLMDPPEVLAATAAYREEQDHTKAFQAERCETDSEHRGYGIYGAYKTWAEDSGLRPLGAARFTERLERQGFQTGIDRRGRYFLGVQLLGARA